MLNKKERMEKLNNAGVDTSKYFTVDLPHGLKPGAKIQLVINDNGCPMVVADDYDKNTVFADDCVAKQIIADGYVRNTKLHRRWVMAQMFQMLNYKSYDGYDKGYSACLRRDYSYQYTFDMMLEEVRVLSKLEVRDKETFKERSHFFTKDVVIEVASDYVKKLRDYVESLPTKKCKGVPYKRIKGVDIFVEDLEKKLYRPLMNKIVFHIKYAHDYIDMYRFLKDFMNDMIKLPSDTPKSKAWIDAFKGEGAYYTLKNLVMYHNCKICEESYGRLGLEHTWYSGVDAVKCIGNKLDEYQGEGWRMFALMKKVIADNNFNFTKRMSEIYGE